MKNLLPIALSLCFAINLFAQNQAQDPTPKPTVEAVFVLDTTGSMSGLIAGAKAKIWQIANQILNGDPRPEVRFGLVPYRDKGDEYVTKVFNLSDNLDSIYEDLTRFKADGGGDTPENVNQALHDALNKVEWGKNPNTLKIIFLVGDCPPHNEYQDVPTYDKLAREALSKGIIINTVLCGNNSQAQDIWKEIAQIANGKFMAIQQNGGVVHIETPYDKELADMTGRRNETLVTYGTVTEQLDMQRQATNAADTSTNSVSVQASRNAVMVKSGKIVGSKGDLVDQIKNENLAPEDIKLEYLPEPMKKMSVEERKQYLAEQQTKREKIDKDILELNKKREEYIAKEMAKNADAKDGFDQQVIDALQDQATKIGVKYQQGNTDKNN
jgi:Mg-chelatase subunit ChlD